MNKEDLSKILGARAKRCITLSNGLLDSGHYILAGSAIATPEIRDIDVYPVTGREFIIPKEKRVVETKNAVTIQNTPLLQFCRFEKPDLQSLISLFDFAHIQAGVRIEDGAVVEIKWTEEFLYSGACQTSCFTGSGFNGWEDFKDQLDAVDLGLIPEEQTELVPALREIYFLLDKGAK